MTDTEQKRIKAICEVAHIDDISDLSDGYHTFKQLYYQRMILFAALVKQNRDKAWKSLRHEDGELCFGGGWFIVGIDTPKGSYTYHYEDAYFSLFDCEELERGKHWDGHTEKDVIRLLSLQQQQPNEDEKIIRIKKGTLKVRTGRYVIYDVEWLKEHFNTTEAKIYGQPSEDCISRKAVLDALHRHFADGFDSDKWWNSTHVLDAINKTPSATPQPKTGHWIWCASSHKCSNCGGYVCFSHKKLLKYCPNCGAKMQEVKK